MSHAKKSTTGLLIAVVSAVTFLPLSACALRSPQQQARASPSANRVVLDNGLTVLLYPVLGAEQVAIESFYRVGFLHEPKGMTQAAHLVEHLLCQCATQTYKAGESMRPSPSK